MFRTRNIQLALLSLVTLLNLSSAAPTNAGSLINSTSTALDYNNTLITQVTFNTNEYVGAIYGFTLIVPTAERTVTVSGMQPVYLNYRIFNQANITDNWTLTLNVQSPSWSYTFIQDDNNDGTHQSGEITAITSITVPAQTTANVFLKMTPIFLVPVTTGIVVSGNGTNYCTYTGVNLNTYGGFSLLSVTDSIVVSADITNPYLSYFKPDNGSVEVPLNQSVVIGLSDAQSGINTGSVTIAFTNIVQSIGISYNLSGNYFLAMVNGVIQPGFQVTTSYDESGTYTLTIVSMFGLEAGKEVSVRMEFADRSATPNSTIIENAFRTQIGETELREVKRPLAFPSIFDPGKENTKIYFELSKDADIKLIIYDLSGYQVYKTEMTGHAGKNFLEWDGSGTIIRKLSNGIYFFYVTEGRSVLGRGKIIIMREGSMELR